VLSPRDSYLTSDGLYIPLHTNDYKSLAFAFKPKQYVLSLSAIVLYPCANADPPFASALFPKTKACLPLAFEFYPPANAN